MFFWKNKKIELNLGSETDDVLYVKICTRLVSIGAELVRSSNSHAGSQDILIDVYALRGEEVKLIRETYVGLSIVGPKNLIESIYPVLISSDRGNPIGARH